MIRENNIQILIIIIIIIMEVILMIMIKLLIYNLMIIKEREVKGIKKKYLFYAKMINWLRSCSIA